jgi:phytanoyl-CoA hydroxylase
LLVSWDPSEARSVFST